MSKADSKESERDAQKRREIEQEIDQIKADALFFLLKGGGFVKRGDYDHNHALNTSNATTIIITIMIAVVILGGLAVGLAILGRL